MKFLLSAVLSIASLSALAKVNPEEAMKFVPGGSIVETKSDEVKIKSTKGGIVELEFKRNGELDEASGDMIESDSFVPGKEYLPLEKITAALKEQGYQLKGDWNYEKSLTKDWYYEVEAFQDNQEYELVVDAKTAKVMDKKRED